MSVCLSVCMCVCVCDFSRMLLSTAGSRAQTVASKASRVSREPTGDCDLSTVLC